MHGHFRLSELLLLSLENEKKHKKRKEKLEKNQEKKVFIEIKMVRFDKKIRAFYLDSDPGSAHLTHQPGQPSDLLTPSITVGYVDFPYLSSDLLTRSRPIDSI